MDLVTSTLRRCMGQASRALSLLHCCYDLCFVIDFGVRKRLELRCAPTVAHLPDPVLLTTVWSDSVRAHWRQARPREGHATTPHLLDLHVVGAYKCANSWKYKRISPEIAIPVPYF